MQSRPFHTMTNFWEPYIICSLIFKKSYRISCRGICRFKICQTRNIPPSGSSPTTLMHTVYVVRRVFFFVFFFCDRCVQQKNLHTVLFFLQLLRVNRTREKKLHNVTLFLYSCLPHKKLHALTIFLYACSPPKKLHNFTAKKK